MAQVTVVNGKLLAPGSAGQTPPPCHVVKPAIATALRPGRAGTCPGQHLEPQALQIARGRHPTDSQLRRNRRHAFDGRRGGGL